MLNINYFASNGIVENGKVVRQKAAAEFGSWFSDNATPAELASWAEARINTYQGWIDNCKDLKREMQKELIKGLDTSELRNLLAEKEKEEAES